MHTVTYSGGTKAAPHTQAVRNIEQQPYEDIMNISEAKAKAFLVKQGVIGRIRSSPREGIVWWSRGRFMKPQRDNSLRCVHDQCTVRSKVSHPHLAYSPFYTQASAGRDINYAGFLRTCSCRVFAVPGTWCPYSTKSTVWCWHLQKRSMRAKRSSKMTSSRWIRAVQAAKLFVDHDIIKVVFWP